MEYSIRPLLPKGTSMHLEHYYVVFSGFSGFNWNLCVGKLRFELSLEHFYGLEQQHKIDEMFIQNPMCYWYLHIFVIWILLPTNWLHFIIEKCS